MLAAPLLFSETSVWHIWIWGLCNILPYIYSCLMLTWSSLNFNRIKVWPPAVIHMVTDHSQHCLDFYGVLMNEFLLGPWIT